MNLKKASPKEVRDLISNNAFADQTSGLCEGHVQGNLAILPKDLAHDFLLFCEKNPKPCPLLEVGHVGQYNLNKIAKDCDIRKEIPKYRVYEDGVLTGEYHDISNIWKDDFVFFILGCSFTFESALLDNNIEVRHITENKNVPMYITNIECEPAGVFSGPMVVSMRPVAHEHITKVVEITSKYPKVHGAPIHIGDPSLIGIHNINKPDFGDSVTIKDGEVPVFWACGVTPQAVAMNVKPPIMITHAPGHMLICDIKNKDLESF